MPKAAPPVATNVQKPRALLRSFPSLKVISTIESAAGDMNAAESPWNARKIISWIAVVEMPMAKEKTVNTIIPKSKIRRRPKRSAVRPPRSKNPPKQSVYEVITHWRELAVKWRSVCIEGRATFVIALSRTTMNWAIATSTNMNQGELFFIIIWMRHKKWLTPLCSLSIFYKYKFWIIYNMV